MSKIEQGQAAADGSTAIQAGRDVSITNVGLSLLEVREVALDVFRANFYRLAEPAMEVARARAEEITDKFLARLQTENPDGFVKAQDPDFQHGLITMQTAYARTGDKDLGDLLVDLLVDRSKQDNRDILQIVLNESLATAPKLTDAQLAVLATVFCLRYAKTTGVGNHQLLGQFLDMYVLPFATKLVKNFATFQHLEFTGCGSIQLTGLVLEEKFSRTYTGLFLKGLDGAQIAAQGITNGADRFFVPCLNDRTKKQVRALNVEDLKASLTEHEIDPDNGKKIIDLFDQNKMTHDEIRAKIIEIRPQMETVFDVWSGSSMKSLALTSVGMAIGHANIKRLVGREFASLSIWIN